MPADASRARAARPAEPAESQAWTLVLDDLVAKRTQDVNTAKDAVKRRSKQVADGVSRWADKSPLVAWLKESYTPTAHIAFLENILALALFTVVVATCLADPVWWPERIALADLRDEIAGAGPSASNNQLDRFCVAGHSQGTGSVEPKLLLVAAELFSALVGPLREGASLDSVLLSTEPRVTANSTNSSGAESSNSTNSTNSTATNSTATNSTATNSTANSTSQPQDDESGLVKLASSDRAPLFKLRMRLHELRRAIPRLIEPRCGGTAGAAERSARAPPVEARFVGGARDSALLRQHNMTVSAETPLSASSNSTSTNNNTATGKLQQLDRTKNNMATNNTATNNTATNTAPVGGHWEHTLQLGGGRRVVVSGAGEVDTRDLTLASEGFELSVSRVDPRFPVHVVRGRWVDADGETVAEADLGEM